MFTIKHITNTSESLIEAREVAFVRKGEGADSRGPHLAFTAPNGVDAEVEGGEAYVMNAQGSTVARYALTAA